MARAKNGKKASSQVEETTSVIDEQSVSPNESAREEIECRAYEIYLARGGQHGYDQDDWLQAEREAKETQANDES